MSKQTKCDYCDRDDATLHVIHVACKSIPYDRIVAVCPAHRSKLEELKHA